MGYQVIRQPDGLLAIFSSITDTWVVYDASPDDVVGWFADIAERDAREAARRTVDVVMAGEASKRYFQFAMTFNEANALSGEGGGVVLPASPSPEGEQQ
jgi:hypothetical protein